MSKIPLTEKNKGKNDDDNGGDENPSENTTLSEDNVTLREKGMETSEDKRGTTSQKNMQVLWGMHPRKLLSKPTRRIKPESAADNEGFFKLANILWAVFFGWWMGVVFALAAGLLFITVVGRNYARLCWKLAIYFCWPFGKYVIDKGGISVFNNRAPGENNSLLRRSGEFEETLVSKTVYRIFLCSIILPICGFGMMMNWFFVVTIPMAKAIFTIVKMLVLTPNRLDIVNNYTEAQSYAIQLCSYRAANIMYFRYNWLGVNIVFLNLIPIVFARVLLIFAGFFGLHVTIVSALFQFFVNLMCTIPVTFFIGISIASIASQTNYMIGAILNATFGSLTELVLFTIALNHGSLNDLILYSLTGSLLCDMLLLPGLSMIFGGLKYHEQKFNARAAGVSSLLLFIAVFGAYTPTIFYHVFGRYQQTCNHCVFRDDEFNETEIYCTDCHYSQEDLDGDPAFIDAVKYLVFITAAALPIAYIIGMIFTFKTHAHIFEDDEGEGEEGAEWSIFFSVFVLVVSIGTFGLIAENIVELLQDVLTQLGVSQAFLGVTLIAWAPAATEIVNAIKFALSDQISLSVGIGSASAIQVALIQMPALIFISMIVNHGAPFHLVFPLLNVFSVILAVLTFNYISSEGKTNYFVGTSLTIMYLIIISAFYFVKSDAPDAHNTTHLEF